MCISGNLATITSLALSDWIQASYQSRVCISFSKTQMRLAPSPNATLLMHEEQHNIDPWAAHLQDDEAAVFIATSQRVRMKGTVRIVSCQNHGLVQRTSATWRCSGQPAALSLPLLNLWLRWCCDSHAASMLSGFHESIGPCRVDLGSNFLVRHDCTNSPAYIESA